MTNLTNINSITMFPFYISIICCYEDTSQRKKFPLGDLGYKKELTKVAQIILEKMQRFKIQVFDKNENDLLLDFYNKPISSSGNINLVLDHSPDIWKSSQVEGFNNIIIAAIDCTENKIAAAMICSQKKFCFNDEFNM
ncbi:MAG: hypothetical protein MZV63_57935 [Marinilabiliales bacterium]|nr:hypothetical protein [Marinilabiliales bacterium]